MYGFVLRLDGASTITMYQISALAFNHNCRHTGPHTKATFTFNRYLQCPMPLVQRQSLLGDPSTVQELKGRTPRGKARVHAVVSCPKMRPRPVHHNPQLRVLFKAIPHEQGQVGGHLPTVRHIAIALFSKGLIFPSLVTPSCEPI